MTATQLTLDGDTTTTRYIFHGRWPSDATAFVTYRYTRAEIIKHYCTPAEFDRLLAGEEFHTSKACHQWIYRIEGRA